MGDITFSAGALAVITALLTALSGTIGLLFRALMASKDASLKDMTTQRDSYQKMAAQSIAALELAANRARRARGELPFVPIPAVVAEHNSPTTQAQADTAEFQTLLARGTRAARMLALPALNELPTEAEDVADVDDADDDTPTVLISADSHDVRLKVGEAVTITAEQVEP